MLIDPYGVKTAPIGPITLFSAGNVERVHSLQCIAAESAIYWCYHCRLLRLYINQCSFFYNNLLVWKVCLEVFGSSEIFFLPYGIT